MRTIIIKRSIIKRSRPSQHTIRTRPRHVDSGTIKPRRVVPSVALILQFVVVRLIQDSIPSSSYRSPKTARRIASVPFASLSLLSLLSLSLSLSVALFVPCTPYPGGFRRFLERRADR